MNSCTAELCGAAWETTTIKRKGMSGGQCGTSGSCQVWMLWEETRFEKSLKRLRWISEQLPTQKHVFHWKILHSNGVPAPSVALLGNGMFQLMSGIVCSSDPLLSKGRRFNGVQHGLNLP